MKRVFAFHEGHAIYNGSENEWALWDWDTVTTVVTGMIAGGDDVPTPGNLHVISKSFNLALFWSIYHIHSPE